MFTLLFPISAHASGGDILSLIWLEVGLFVCVAILMFISSFEFKHKLIIFTVYIGSAIAALGITSSMPYSENLIFINIISVIIPILASAITWGWCAKHAKT